MQLFKNESFQDGDINYYLASELEVELCDNSSFNGMAYADIYVISGAALCLKRDF